MPHVLTASDGRTYTVFDERDVLSLVEDYAGQDIRSWLEDFLSDLRAEVEGSGAEVQEYRDDIDKLQDHQRLVLTDIYEDASWLMKLTDESRLRRKDIRGCAERIWNVLNREL